MDKLYIKLCMICCSLFLTCFSIFNSCFIVSFFIVLLFNLNNNTCETGMSIQAFDFCLLAIQTFCSCTISITLCLRKEGPSRYTPIIFMTIIQIIIALVMDSIGIVYLNNYYNCFQDMKLLWIYTVIYLILITLDGFANILQSCIWIFMSEDNKYDEIKSETSLEYQF